MKSDIPSWPWSATQIHRCSASETSASQHVATSAEAEHCAPGAPPVTSGSAAAEAGRLRHLDLGTLSAAASLAAEAGREGASEQPRAPLCSEQPAMLARPGSDGP